MRIWSVIIGTYISVKHDNWSSVTLYWNISRNDEISKPYSQGSDFVNSIWVTWQFSVPVKLPKNRDISLFSPQTHGCLEFQVVTVYWKSRIWYPIPQLYPKTSTSKPHIPNSKPQLLTPSLVHVSFCTTNLNPFTKLKLQTTNTKFLTTLTDSCPCGRYIRYPKLKLKLYAKTWSLNLRHFILNPNFWPLFLVHYLTQAQTQNLNPRPQKNQNLWPHPFEPLSSDIPYLKPKT